MNDDLIEAWEHTKSTACKWWCTLRILRSGGVESKFTRLPFNKRHHWSEEENVWRDEMEELWGES